MMWVNFLEYFHEKCVMAIQRIMEEYLIQNLCIVQVANIVTGPLYHKVIECRIVKGMCWTWTSIWQIETVLV